MNLSVIIPILNSQSYIEKNSPNLVTLAKLANEIIIVDGTSQNKNKDEGRKTLKKLKLKNLKIFSCKSGRGRQLHYGAKKSTSDFLLFLHIDSYFNAKKIALETVLKQFLTSKAIKNSLGFFKLSFSNKSLKAQILEKLVALRVWIFKLPYGDQGYLISKSLYKKIGGFNPHYPLMEDIDIIKKIKKNNLKLKLLPLTIKTSFSKYKKGYFKRIIKNFFCLSLFYLRVNPKTINKIY